MSWSTKYVGGIDVLRTTNDGDAIITLVNWWRLIRKVYNWKIRSKWDLVINLLLQLMLLVPVPMTQLLIRMFVVLVTWIPSVFGLVPNALITRLETWTLVHLSKETCIFWLFLNLRLSTFKLLHESNVTACKVDEFKWGLLKYWRPFMHALINSWIYLASITALFMKRVPERTVGAFVQGCRNTNFSSKSVPWWMEEKVYCWFRGKDTLIYGCSYKCFVDFAWVLPPCLPIAIESSTTFNHEILYTVKHDPVLAVCPTPIW